MVSDTFWVLDWGMVAATIQIWTDWIGGYHPWNPVWLLMQTHNPSILWWRATSSLAFAMLTRSIYVYFSVWYLADMVALVVWLLVYIFLCINTAIYQQLSSKLNLVPKLQFQPLLLPVLLWVTGSNVIMCVHSWDPSYHLSLPLSHLKTWATTIYCLDVN